MILMLMNPRKNRLFISFKFFLLLFFTKSFLMAQIESQDYKIIQSFNDVEIRLYSPVMLAKYSSKNSGSGFGKLFRYISGNNDQNIKIAMTTPVHMERGEISSMAFVLPKKFSKNNAPLPIDKSLNVFEKESGYFAAIRYSGYTNSEKELNYISKLRDKLIQNKIEISGEATVLVYNSPYKVFNRRNEIIIPINFRKK
tara:strand:- start:502 stop:1095 length:594 start_codon:yes stop_codon:yes gene_type:complete